MVQLLLKRGAEPNKAGKFGVTPLYLAVDTGFTGVPKILIKRGAEVDKPDNSGCTPLHMAVMRGHKKMVQVLLEAGADPRKEDQWCRTPLSVANQGAAMRRSYFETVKMLTDAVN